MIMRGVGGGHEGPVSDQLLTSSLPPSSFCLLGPEDQIAGVVAFGRLVLGHS